MVEAEKLGFYEKRLIVLLFLSTIPNALLILQPVILHYTPEHRCNVHGQDHSAIQLLESASGRKNYANMSELSEESLNLTIPWEETDDGKPSRSRCFQFDLSLNSSQRNLTKIRCRAMHYKGNEVSAVTEFNLVCDKAWIKPILSSLMFVGMMIGSLASGYFADRFGRKPVFLIATGWQFATVLALSFAPGIWSYAFLFLMCGVGGTVNYGVASVIGSEMTTQKYRLSMFFVILVGFSVGYMLMSPLSYLFPDWRWFLRFSGLIGVLYIPYYWLIDETPRWLYASGKTEQAEKILLKIAKLNGYPCRNTLELKHNEEKKFLTALETILRVAKERVLLLRLAISVFIWFILGMMYFVLALGTNSLSGNRFINLFLSAFVDFLGCLLFLLGERKLGRVTTYIIPTMLLGLSMLLTCIIPSSQVHILLALNLLSKLTIAISFAIVYVHIMEIFPTRARPTVLLFVHAIGKVGGFVAPFLIYVGEDGDSMTSSLVVTSLVFLSAVGAAFLPETKGAPLPQTVQEASDLPRKQWCACRYRERRIAEASEVELSPLDGAVA